MFCVEEGCNKQLKYCSSDAIRKQYRNGYWCDSCNGHKVDVGSYQCGNIVVHKQTDGEPVDICPDCYHKQDSVPRKASSVKPVVNKQSNAVINPTPDIITVLSNLTNLIQQQDPQTVNLLSHLSPSNYNQQQQINSNINDNNHNKNSTHPQIINHNSNRNHNHNVNNDNTEPINSNTNHNKNNIAVNDNDNDEDDDIREYIAFGLSPQSKERLKSIKMDMFNHISADGELTNPYLKAVIALTAPDYDDKVEAQMAKNCKRSFVLNVEHISGDTEAYTTDLASLMQTVLSGNPLTLYTVIRETLSNHRMPAVEKMEKKCKKMLEDSFVKVTINVKQLLVDCISAILALNIDCNLCWATSDLRSNNDTAINIRQLLIDELYDMEFYDMSEEESVGDINIIVGNVVLGYVECAQILQVRHDENIFTDKNSFGQCVQFVRQLPKLLSLGNKTIESDNNNMRHMGITLNQDLNLLVHPSPPTVPNESTDTKKKNKNSMNSVSNVHTTVQRIVSQLKSLHWFQKIEELNSMLFFVIFCVISYPHLLKYYKHKYWQILFCDT